MPPAEREAVFQPRCLDDLQDWLATDPRLLTRIMRLIREVLRDPFKGTGKPEPLKHRGSDLWSRRIDDEHRLVYRVAGDRIEFLRARGHYE